MKTVIFILPIMLLVSAWMNINSNLADTSRQTNENAPTDTSIVRMGQVLIEQYCYSCHTPQMTGEKRLAPPIQMVKMHYLSDYESKELFVAAISDWVKEPKIEKSIMPGALNRFGLMPGLAIDDEDLKRIAEYLYDADLPSVPGHGKGNMYGKHGRGHN